VIDGCFGVLDHEIGHNWGVFIGTELGSGHWLANSTATGQMASTNSDDGWNTVKQISGNPSSGFTWTAIDNLVRNETETFSDQDLYLQGFAATFPAVHVFNSPVFNPDHSVSYSSVSTYDQNWVEAHNGPRSPDYRDSDKKLRIAVVYVARDLSEIQNVYKPIEGSMNHYSNSESIDVSKFRFQVPFLVETKMRASVNALLSDLDGNSTPTISLDSHYMLSSDGAAQISFDASDADGPTPIVSCVPVSANCQITGNNINLSGLGLGAHFLSVKAQDSAGKKSFEHFVIDVQ